MKKIMRCGVMLLAAVFVLGGCSKDPGQLFESAKNREAKGDRVGAIIDLKSALQVDPKYGSMRFMLGRLYNESFDFESAEKELRRAAELGVVEGGRVTVELGQALRGQGKFKQIIAEINVSPAYEPQQVALIHSLRGRASLQLGDLEAASTALKDAQTLAPERPEVRLFEAQLRVAHSDVSGAEAIVDGVLQKFPKNFEALAYKGRVLREQGRPAAAVDVYRRMLEIYPSHFQALLNRSMLYIQLGKLTEAKKDIDKLAQSYKGDRRVNVQRGVWLLESGKPQEALEFAQLALKAEPAPPQAHLLAGLAYLEIKSPVQASTALSKYLIQVPGSVIARRALANAFLRQNQAAKALEVLGPMLEADLNDPAIYALAGEASALAGDITQASKWYTKAADIAPTNVGLLARKVLMRVGSGNSEDGLDELSGALQQTKVATTADELLILGYLGKKRLGEASAAVEALEKRAPNSSLAANLRGIVALAKGDKAGAEQAFDKALKLKPDFLPAVKNRARLDLVDGKPEVARARFEGVLAIRKSDLSALLALAELDQIQGRMSSSIEWLQRATQAHPEAIGPRARLANAYMQQGDGRKAAETVEEVLARHGDNPWALQLAGDVYLSIGNTTRAIQSLARLAQSSQSGTTFFQLARAELVAKQVKAGEASLRKALQLQPDYAPAQVGLAALLTQNGRADEALKFAHSLQSKQPKSPIGFVIEGEIHEAQGKLPGALSAYRSAFSRQSSGALAISIYRIREKAGESAAALAELEKWLAEHQGEIFARHLAAAAHAKAGDFKTAANRYGALAQQNGRDSEALNGLAWTLNKLGDARALSVAEAAYRLASNSPTVQDTLGWILLQNGDLQRGTKLLKEARKAIPNDRNVWFHLAVATQKGGDIATARKELEALLAAKGEFSEEKEAKALLASLR